MTHTRDTFKWSNGQDEPVEVNQRGLIDKVLARYSGELTVFRELLQNSDDAESSAVEIRFETDAHLLRKSSEQGISRRRLPNFKSISVAQWTFRNNGNFFRDEDWTRLRKIAEGNPDEKKIGAFGVGFYSLFSVTENPFVSSGGHAMEFYWNKDQLKVRRGDLPTKGVADPWTTFEMALRQAAPIPPLHDLLRFLASSITFMIHMNDVSVYFDEHRIGHIKKSSGMAMDVDIPGTLKRSSASNIMNVRSVLSRPIKIEAEFLLARNTVEAAQLTVTVFTAEVDVKVNDALSAEFSRSTKKRPPAQVKYHLTYTGKDEHDKRLTDSKNQHAAGGSILRGLHADLDGSTNTRIFIGHATGQTTGIGGHMASYFIPTVERECLDFVDRNIAIWNKELLYVGGFLSRIVYDLELSAIDNAWTGATDGLWSQPDLQAYFLHTLKFFAFHRSTPSAEVAELLKASFYGCTSVPLRMLTSVGVRGASSIKKYDSGLAEFLRDVPMLPSIVRECESTIPVLQDQEMISPMTFSDVVYNLRQNPLPKEDLVPCLRWWIYSGCDLSGSNMVQLLSATLFKNVDGSLIPLSSIQHFIHTLGDYIPQDCPLPTSLLPLDVTRDFRPGELDNFGWQEFTVVHWLHHISDPQVVSMDPAHDFTRSIDWAARVLSVLCRVWKKTPSDDRSLVKEALADKPCIPTSSGLRTPKGSYFPGTSTHHFQDLDLPTVQFSSGFRKTKVVKAFLAFIGVRKYVDPQLIIDRMAETGIWNTTALITYLVEVRKFLTEDELVRLRSSAIFSKEDTPSDTNRCCPQDLYAPIEIMRQLQLPVIAWHQKSKWSHKAIEAKLLLDLGLRQFPPLEEIIDLCSSEDARVSATAFRYLCDNLSSKYPNYKSGNFANVAFVPAGEIGVHHVEKLGDVFSDTQWKALGFSVVSGDYPRAPMGQLGIKRHPSPSMLLSCLEKTPPPDEVAARKWFEILFEPILTFDSDDLAALSKLPIVPTTNSESGVRTWLTPTRCYLDQGTRDDFHSKLFVFVDFGLVANRFLSACGSRNGPSVAEIAECLVDNPKRFYTHAGGHRNFLTHLRNLAVNQSRIPNTTLDKMKVSPILLGKKADSLRGSNRYALKLRNPKEIVIADDSNAHRLFREAVFIAPQDELLEDFYLSLGCERLSTVVHEQCMVVDEVEDGGTSSSMRTKILERLTLFLRECTHAKPEVTVDWLSNPENFKVKLCKKLTIFTTLTFRDDKTMRSQNVSAGAKKVDQGRVELWLSKSYDEPDMYEISISLCRLLFGAVRVSQSLLLTTILSTDLEALRRRGCNVDLLLERRQIGHDDQTGDSDWMSRVTSLNASEVSIASTCRKLAPRSRGGWPISLVAGRRYI